MTGGLETGRARKTSAGIRKRGIGGYREKIRVRESRHEVKEVILSVRPRVSVRDIMIIFFKVYRQRVVSSRGGRGRRSTGRMSINTY